MITKTVDLIQTGDILAEDVVLDGTVLIPKGTALKEDYINNLQELNIELISVENEERDEDNYLLPGSFVETQYAKVKEVLERLIHGNESTLEHLQPVAEEIRVYIANHLQEIDKISLPSRAPDLYMHSIIVCALSCLVAHDLKVEEKDLEDIALGALFHDVGYRYVAADYENVDIDTLTPGEVFEVKKHTIYGFSAMDGQKWIDEKAKMIVLSHHERTDGSGYPLKQKKLTKEIQIVSVCDGYDSLISGNGCKLCQPKEALETLRSWCPGLNKEMVEVLSNRIIV